MIKFGTSGWRAVIADEFTFDNVKLVTQAIADYVNKQKNDSRSVFVGYDTRFLSEEYAKIACSVLAANGIKALYSKRDSPTPVVSYEIVNKKLAGGINFTASHNPPEYNGIKFSPSWGGPALPETTKIIEERCKELSANPEEIKDMDFDDGIKNGIIEITNPLPAYMKRIKKLVDLKSIRKAMLKVGIDLMYGTAREYLDTLLKEDGCKIHTIHGYRDVLFGGHRPEPDEERLAELKKILKKEKLQIGLSCDGDADRFGILDSNGRFINPNEVISVLLFHLIKNRKWKGIACRSVMTTHLIDAIADHFGVEVRETPVGFKYIGDIMVKNPDRFIIGGEESGGLTIRGHIPEKDGILACLLIAEMVAVEKKSITKILADIEKITGKYISTRINLSVKQEIIDKLPERLRNSPPGDFNGIKVKKIITIDGFKFIMEDSSWIGIRLSGTEPIVRIYIESSSKAKIDFIKSSAEQMLG